jgi:octaprenyl-diphosphate synthase
MPATLQDVYRPIQAQIDRLEADLKRLAASFAYPGARQMVGHFFRRPGKYLRPALVLLSAQAAGGSAGGRALGQTAFGMELIHSASLVHDDVVDHDLDRRGQPTLNGAWGNKDALLAGDALYSRAFGVLTEALSKEQMGRVVRMIEGMCSAEIEQARPDAAFDRASYFAIIEGKTAAFMALCCRLGATLAGADGDRVEALEAFGLHFGLAYQLFDDAVDGDLPCADVDGEAEGLDQMALARQALAALAPSEGASSLIGLGDLVTPQRGTRQGEA